MCVSVCVYLCVVMCMFVWVLVWVLVNVCVGVSGCVWVGLCVCFWYLLQDLFLIYYFIVILFLIFIARFIFNLLRTLLALNFFHDFFRGVNHSLKISGNPYSKSEISCTQVRNPFENEKSRTLNAEVIYPSIFFLKNWPFVSQILTFS